MSKEQRTGSWHTPDLRGKTTMPSQRNMRFLEKSAFGDAADEEPHVEPVSMDKLAGGTRKRIREGHYVDAKTLQGELSDKTNSNIMRRAEAHDIHDVITMKDQIVRDRCRDAIRGMQDRNSKLEIIRITRQAAEEELDAMSAEQIAELYNQEYMSEEASAFIEDMPKPYTETTTHAKPEQVPVTDIFDGIAPEADAVVQPEVVTIDSQAAEQPTTAISMENGIEVESESDAFVTLQAGLEAGADNMLHYSEIYGEFDQALENTEAASPEAIAIAAARAELQMIEKAAKQIAPNPTIQGASALARLQKHYKPVQQQNAA